MCKAAMPVLKYRDTMMHNKYELTKLTQPPCVVATKDIK